MAPPDRARRQPGPIRSIAKVSLAAGLLLLASTGWWFFGRPAYRQFKTNRALEQARRALAQGDLRNASLSARQALSVDAADLEACQLMAQVAERLHAPQVLQWRQRIAEIAPTPENKLRLVSTALLVQSPPFPLAAQTLQELPEPARNTAAFHVLSAELALKLNRLDQAEAQFLEASRLEPTNQAHQLNVAVLRLRSTNAVLAAQARATLEALRSSTNLAAIPLRWLIDDRFKHHDLAAAEQYSIQLLALPQALLEDRLTYLSILREAQSPAFDSRLAAEQARAMTNAATLAGVAGWMTSHGLATQALGWLTHCPPRIRAEQSAQVATADAYNASKDWPGLENYLQDQNWGDLDFARLALLSRAAAQEDRPQAADAHWRQAVLQANGRLGPLLSLLTMASNWDRPQARADLLWAIVQAFPRERWAFLELQNLYGLAGNTLGLNRLYGTVMVNEPTNFAAKNNFAATAMLLKINLAQAHETARELYAQHPREGIIASTYAYSLHLQGRTREGLAALEKLPPDVLEKPAVALYYGLLLAADGQSAKAAPFLAKANSATLLPEEKALLAEATSKP